MKRKFFFYCFSLAFILLVQGFQCSSPEFTTAKVALQQRDYQKAEENLMKEIQNNPNNAEAYIYLSEVRLMRNDFMGSAIVINNSDSAVRNSKNFELITRAEQLKGQIWRLAYNFGIDLFNRFFATKDTKFLDSAINVFRAGITVRPQIYDFYPLIAQAYEVKGDTFNAVKYYQLYCDLIKEELNFSRSVGVYLKMPREDLITKIGKPQLSRGIRFSPDRDSIQIDKFDYNNNEVYVYSSDKEGFFTIFGWRVNPPKSWLNDEKEQPTELNTAPFASLAQYYFEKKDYENSAKYVKYILLLEPDNSEANAFLVNIYQLSNKQEEAIKFAESLVAQNPKNRLYHAIYGDILMQLGKYDQAITQYEKALQIDPNFDIALRNCAAAYKNKVAIIQKRQLDENKLNEKEYIGDLEKSAQYFEKARSTPRFANDFEIYKDLAEIYFVSNKQSDLKRIVAELEALEPIVKSEERENYLLALLKVYSSFLKDEKKTKEIQEKIENLRQ